MADRLSTLPNELLIHILSFVPTHDAVATSVLSKRWRGLWGLVPILDFDDRSYYLKIEQPPYYHHQFREFVDTTMSARNMQHPIKKFRLKCGLVSGYNLANYDVVNWVAAVMQRGIETLDIDLPFPEPILLVRFSGSPTLVDLKFSGWLDAGVSPDLPSLKTLHFNGVCLYRLEIFLNFLFGCPNLENLEAKDIMLLHYDPYEIYAYFKRLPKLVRASISFAEHLPIHKYTDDIPAFPNLTHLELLFETYISFLLVFEMLQQCPKLQVLILDVRKRSEIFPVYFPYPAFVPHCISSQLRKCSMANFKGTESELLFAKYIMENSTYLQEMKFSGMSSLNPQEELWIQRMLELCSRRSATCELSFE